MISGSDDEWGRDPSVRFLRQVFVESREIKKTYWIIRRLHPLTAGSGLGGKRRSDFSKRPGPPPLEKAWLGTKEGRPRLSGMPCQDSEIKRH